jgi:hypothetical protein
VEITIGDLQRLPAVPLLSKPYVGYLTYARKNHQHGFPNYFSGNVGYATYYQPMDGICRTTSGKITLFLYRIEIDVGP